MHHSTITHLEALDKMYESFNNILNTGRELTTNAWTAGTDLSVSVVSSSKKEFFNKYPECQKRLDEYVPDLSKVLEASELQSVEEFNKSFEAYLKRTRT